MSVGLASIWSPQMFATSRAGLSSNPSRRALQSILAFGAILTPDTPREAPGRGQTDEYSNALACTRTVLGEERRWLSEPEHADERALNLLDETIESALEGNKKPLLLFSGGVDSSLMAARLRHLGYEDTPLVHYQFSPDDPETAVAVAMADSLGMSIEVIPRDHSGLHLLEDPGRVYPVPFGDHSSAPTRELCSAVAKVASPEGTVVFDGTGADGAFGLGAKAISLNRLMHVPSPVLELASQSYRRWAWRGHGALEYRLRVLRRASQLPRATAVIAQNSLFDIAYDGEELSGLVEDWRDLTATTSVSGETEEIVLTDLAITCAGIFAQKTLGPLTQAGFEVSYPFLSARLGALGVATTSRWPERGAKAWMKEELARHVMPELVYRSKSGFVDPEKALFDSPEFRDSLQGALSSESVWAPLLRMGNLRALLDDGRGRLGALPSGHLNLLWTLAFVDRWYKTTTKP